MLDQNTKVEIRLMIVAYHTDLVKTIWERLTLK